MSVNHVPSKVEVLGWSPQSLAGYMRKLKLAGCDKVVMRSSISGAQFLKMAERDLHVFSAVHLPTISMIQTEINKDEQGKSSAHRAKAHKSSKQAFAQEEEEWDPDEFENDSDSYESPDQEEEDDDNYICALDEEQDNNESCDEAYEVSSPADKARRPPVAKPHGSQPRGARKQTQQQRDPVHRPTSAERTSKAQLSPPGMKPPRPLKPPAASSPQPHVDRKTKPGQPQPVQKDLPKPKRGSIAKAFGSSIAKFPQPWTPKPKDVSNRASKVIPTPPKPTQPATVTNLLPEPEEIQDLDPSWYGGQVTRHQAEVTLRGMNKDGAFVVRDSSKHSDEHPYTLMLLKQGKVYNIKIRSEGDSFSLGTGLNKSFPGVKEMITHHTHTPLLLIDAADQSSEAQNQCCLLHPAGF